MSLSTPTNLKPELGTPVEEVDTPAVIVDLDIMESNLKDYAEFAEEQGAQLRSHAKTHKIPDLAHYQCELTGGGICCQTLSEAEVMSNGGIDDIYLSYMVVGDRKLERLVRLADNTDEFATTVDCPGNVYPVQEAAARHDVTIDIVLEIDVGLNRVGCDPGDQAVDLAKLISEQPNLDLAGLMAYEGHIAYSDESARNEEEYRRRCEEAMDVVAETVEQIEADGIDIDEVKVGSTVTSKYSGKHPIVTEINPGMYPFNDGRLLAAPHIEEDDLALTVHSTIISAPTEDRVVVDAGSKSISLEVDQQPIHLDDKGVDYYNASEEHGWVDVGDADQSYQVGERIEFVPPHVCPTINLHDTLVGVRDGCVENVWSIQGRGKVK